MLAEQQILDCGHAPSEHSSFTTGYGSDDQGRKSCYDCIAEIDRAYMVKTGKITLYDCGDKVTNWPASLSFKIHHRKQSWHNIAGKRFDFWFSGPDGKLWHGYRVGDMTQIAHCKATKG